MNKPTKSMYEMLMDISNTNPTSKLGETILGNLTSSNREIIVNGSGILSLNTSTISTVNLVIDDTQAFYTLSIVAGASFSLKFKNSIKLTLNSNNTLSYCIQMYE